MRIRGIALLGFLMAAGAVLRAQSYPGVTSLGTGGLEGSPSGGQNWKITPAGQLQVSSVASPLINGVYAVDGVTYRKDATGVLAALAAAVAAGGGEVDARGVCKASFSSELDIGTSSDSSTPLVPITLDLPTSPNCSWVSSVSDGVHSGFVAYGNVKIIGAGGGQGSQFTFTTTAAFHGASVFDFDGINTRVAGCLLVFPKNVGGCGSYGYFRGFDIVLDSGTAVSAATVAVAQFRHWGDNTIFENIFAGYLNPASFPQKTPAAGLVYDVCCNATFRNDSFEGQDGYNGTGYHDFGTTPLIVGDISDTWYTLDVVFDRVNPEHPGAGDSALAVYGSHTNAVHFTSIYSEGGGTMNGGTATDTTTPVISIGAGVQNIDIASLSVRFLAPGNTKYLVQVAKGSPAIVVNNIYSDSSGYCVNDLNSGVTVFPKAGTTNCYSASYNSVPGAFSQILGNLRLAETSSSTIGGGYEATPSFGYGFSGGWWSTSAGPTLNQFGNIYAQATQSNVSAAIPVGRTTIQAAASGGALTDVLSVWGDGTLRNRGGYSVLPWSQFTGYNGNSSGVKVPLALGWTHLTTVESLCHDTNGNVTDNPATCSSDVTFTVAKSTTIYANSCSPASGSSGTSVTMSGLTSSMTVTATATTDTSNVIGWGNPAAGVLYILVAPGQGAFTYHVCNNTSSNIATGTSVTFNASAK